MNQTPERKALVQALYDNRQSKAATAKQLGISQLELARKLNANNIKPDNLKP